ncbi:unnamed protein product [Prorocentrum cordatum]|uniref:SREBP regulating gene protein n=1 Tax=Prorocentrum cordatum TaxID=2364126 RepID=A0ABN9S7D8_9DINO|nr:unnamed protein product [Polarella glacialis]
MSAAQRYVYLINASPAFRLLDLNVWVHLGGAAASCCGRLCPRAVLSRERLVRARPLQIDNKKTDLPIVYDSSCPGLCCFEDQPCRYNNTGCYSAALAQQKVRTTPTNDAECKAVKGINTGLPIVYDSSCPGLCCFEDKPCRYNNTGCY